MCTQCEVLMINGIACHETGCPRNKPALECFECGCPVEEGTACCNYESDEGETNESI